MPFDPYAKTPAEGLPIPAAGPVGTTLGNAAAKVSIAGISGAVQSPTGIPVISPKAVPVIAGVVGVAAVLSNVLPPNTVLGKLMSILWQVGSLLGLASPGMRVNSFLKGPPPPGP